MEEGSLEGTSSACLVHPRPPEQWESVNYSKLLRTTSTWVFSISKDSDSTATRPGWPVPVFDHNLITVYTVQSNYPPYFIFCPCLCFHVLPDQYKPHLGSVHSASVPRSQGTVLLRFPFACKAIHLWQTLDGPLHRGYILYPLIYPDLKIEIFDERALKQSTGRPRWMYFI